MLIPAEKHVSRFNGKPDPLFMGAEREGALFQHEAARGVNPGAAGEGETAWLVETFHRQGSQFIRDTLQQVGIHGLPSILTNQILQILV